VFEGKILNASGLRSVQSSGVQTVPLDILPSAPAVAEKPAGTQAPRSSGPADSGAGTELDDLYQAFSREPLARGTQVGELMPGQPRPARAACLAVERALKLPSGLDSCSCRPGRRARAIAAGPPRAQAGFPTHPICGRLLVPAPARPRRASAHPRNESLRWVEGQGVGTSSTATRCRCNVATFLSRRAACWHLQAIERR